MYECHSAAEPKAVWSLVRVVDSLVPESLPLSDQFGNCSFPLSGTPGYAASLTPDS